MLSLFKLQSTRTNSRLPAIQKKPPLSSRLVVPASLSLSMYQATWHGAPDSKHWVTTSFLQAMLRVWWSAWRLRMDSSGPQDSAGLSRGRSSRLSAAFKSKLKSGQLTVTPATFLYSVLEWPEWEGRGGGGGRWQREREMKWMWKIQCSFS